MGLVLKMRRVLSLMLNVLLVTALVAVTLSVRKGLLRPTRNGFFCGDQSIRFPLKKESVRTSLIVVVGTLTVLLISTAAEYLRPVAAASDAKRQRKNCCGLFYAPFWVLRAGKAFLLFLVGFSVNVLLFELGKVSTGVLRPNFIAACAPNVTCEWPADPTQYKSDFACMRADEEEEDDARKSFPSGHAAVVSYMAAFVCLFLQSRPWAFSSVFLLRPAVQVTVVCVAWVTSLSRVADHVHHVSDVVAGIVLGCAVAACAAGLVDQSCQRQEETSGDNESEEDKSNKVHLEEETALGGGIKGGGGMDTSTTTTNSSRSREELANRNGRARHYDG